MNPSLNQTPPDMILYPERSKLVRGMVVSLLVFLLAAGCWAMGGIWRAFAVFFVLVFVPVLFLNMSQFANPKPIFIVDAHGVTDTGTLTSCGFIPWKEIEHAEIADVNSGEFLLIFLHNSAALLARQPLIKRGAVKANASMAGTPVTISALTSVPLEEMLVPIQARLAARDSSVERL